MDYDSVSVVCKTKFKFVKQSNTKKKEGNGTKPGSHGFGDTAALLAAKGRRAEASADRDFPFSNYEGGSK